MKLSDKELEEISQAANEILSHPDKIREFLANPIGETSPLYRLLEGTSDVQETTVPKNICDHGVTFDAADAKTLGSTAAVRKKYPRGWGPCPKGCGYDGIAYASWQHYYAGDW